MGSAARNRPGTPDPLDEVRLVLLAAGGLLEIMGELHDRLVRMGTQVVPAPVLLAEAHIFEAVDILRSVTPKPRDDSSMVPAAKRIAAA
jgi:hypothetical protein